MIIDSAKQGKNAFREKLLDVPLVAAYFPAETLFSDLKKVKKYKLCNLATMNNKQ